MEFGIFKSNIGCMRGCIVIQAGAGIGIMLMPSVFMDDRLLNQVGVMAPLILVRQTVKQPVHIFERRASAVQGRGQLVHSIYRICG